MTRLQEMIGLTPKALNAVAAMDISAAAQRLRPAGRLLLTGTGTSHHAAQLGAYLLRGAGLDAQAVACSELVRWHPPLRDGDGLIVITHTGQTAYARAARAAALEAGVPLLSITGPRVQWPEAVHTPITEESETYTVSYITALGVLGLLAHELTGVDSGHDALGLAAGSLAAVIADPEIAAIEPPRRALTLVGPGIWSVTAREGALKLREAAHLLAEGYDSELLLHGSAVPLGREDVLIALAPEADADGLTAAVLQAAAREGVRTHTLSGEPGAQTPAEVFIAQLLTGVRLQLLAAQFAHARHTDPDVVITGAWTDDALWSAGSPRS